MTLAKCLFIILVTIFVGCKSRNSSRAYDAGFFKDGHYVAFLFNPFTKAVSYVDCNTPTRPKNIVEVRQCVTNGKIEERGPVDLSAIIKVLNLENPALKNVLSKDQLDELTRNHLDVSYISSLLSETRQFVPTLNRNEDLAKLRQFLTPAVDEVKIQKIAQIVNIMGESLFGFLFAAFTEADSADSGKGEAGKAITSSGPTDYQNVVVTVNNIINTTTFSNGGEPTTGSGAEVIAGCQSQKLEPLAKCDSAGAGLVWKAPYGKGDTGPGGFRRCNDLNRSADGPSNRGVWRLPSKAELQVNMPFLSRSYRVSPTFEVDLDQSVLVGRYITSRESDGTYERSDLMGEFPSEPIRDFEGMTICVREATNSPNSNIMIITPAAPLPSAPSTSHQPVPNAPIETKFACHCECKSYRKSNNLFFGSVDFMMSLQDSLASCFERLQRDCRAHLGTDLYWLPGKCDKS